MAVAACFLDRKWTFSQYVFIRQKGKLASQLRIRTLIPVMTAPPRAILEEPWVGCERNLAL